MRRWFDRPRTALGGKSPRQVLSQEADPDGDAARAGRAGPFLRPDRRRSHMTIGFRHGDTRHPFFWEGPEQPPARWHGPGEGPVQYLADTPDGAWAELLRHEELTDPADLAGIRRRLWAVEVPDGITESEPIDLPTTVVTAGARPTLVSVGPQEPPR